MTVQVRNRAGTAIVAIVNLRREADRQPRGA